MNNVETKKIDLKIKGKKGFVNANYIQRHKPDANMVFIQFDLDPYMLFCQENHPVIIYEKLPDGEYLEHVIEAKDVRRGDIFYIDVPEQRHQRCIDKSIIEEVKVKHLYEEINHHINNKEKLNDNPYKVDLNVIVGDDKYNFCFSDKVVEQYSNEWFYLFFTLISSNKYTGKLLEFYSFNFVSQLAMIAYSMNMLLRFQFHKENCSWTVGSFDSNLNNYNDYMLWKDSYSSNDMNYIEVYKVIKGIDNFNGYVYDIKTETGEFINNGVQTHNSFHTGGAVEFKKINILKELADSISTEDESHLARVVSQKDNDLYSNTNLIVINIDKKLFKDEFKIEEESDRYKLPLGYFNMRVGTIEINATIEMPVEIFKSNDVKEDDDKIHIMYGNGEKLFFIKFFKIAPEKIAAGIDNLVAGRSPWKKPEDLLKKFHENLAQFGGYDMTHLEVLIGTILRNKKDPMIPARLKEPYDPETHSIKSLPSLVSWSLGIAYENIGRSLSYGLISQDTKNLSSIEKVLFGEPLSDLSIDLLKEKKLKRR